MHLPARDGKVGYLRPCRHAPANSRIERPPAPRGFDRRSPAALHCAPPDPTATPTSRAAMSRVPRHDLTIPRRQSRSATSRLLQGCTIRVRHAGTARRDAPSFIAWLSSRPRHRLHSIAAPIPDTSYCRDLSRLI